MCSWERFCAFAREPERRKVGGDARITVEGVVYEVDPELAGETVVLWWGLFDRDLFVEHGERRFGPYRPSGGPIPLHRYRKHKRTARDERADRIAALATKLAVPRAALAGHPELEAAAEARPAPPPSRPFVDPDPFRELVYPSAIEAKRAIADLLGVPLGRLAAEERAAIDAILGETLERGRRAGARPGPLRGAPRRETAGAERGDGALRPGVAARRGRLLRDRAPPDRSSGR